ncbi:hypothetical protein KC19_VG112500 [Ceratodon purpureus]|uniref:Uncharacterized protein n=1 Tax=Ceratodon purpureus TaxID=3225 RepID=A0A8T0HP83_CERPU|nr:hypothetical protein KC19_VG112500 [Ceratodon purpureus]
MQCSLFLFLVMACLAVKIFDPWSTFLLEPTIRVSSPSHVIILLRFCVFSVLFLVKFHFLILIAFFYYNYYFILFYFISLAGCISNFCFQS